MLVVYEGEIGEQQAIDESLASMLMVLLCCSGCFVERYAVDGSLVFPVSAKHE